MPLKALAIEPLSRTSNTRIRKTEGFIPSLSLVADSDGFIIGHAIFREVTVYSGETAWKAVALGPIAVMPELQRQGVGGMLIRTGMQRCHVVIGCRSGSVSLAEDLPEATEGGPSFPSTPF